MLHTHYLVCLGCKKILSIRHCPLEAYEKSLADETQYTSPATGWISTGIARNAGEKSHNQVLLYRRREEISHGTLSLVPV